MTVDIIVPHYKEPWETCKYLFDSISMQRGIPFEMLRVLIINDGFDCIFNDDELKKYPYHIDYAVKEHEGVSATRNFGLEQSNADYVMFCDADDGFLNNWGLHLLFSAMGEGHDMIVTPFVEEIMDENGSLRIIRHDKDMTFVHGKAYRRQFLLEKKLSFDNNMSLHEDGYFNMLAYAESKHSNTLKYTETPIYLWRWNPDSVVRKNKGDFVLKTYPEVMKTRIGICEQLRYRGFENDFEDAVCATILNSYYDFQKPSYHDIKNRRYLKSAEQAFKKFWSQFYKTFHNCTNQKIAEIAQSSRANACKNGMLMEQQDLKTWLRHIEYEVKS